MGFGLLDAANACCMRVQLDFSEWLLVFEEIPRSYFESEKFFPCSGGLVKNVCNQRIRSLSFLQQYKPYKIAREWTKLFEIWNWKLLRELTIQKNNANPKILHLPFDPPNWRSILALFHLARENGKWLPKWVKNWIYPSTQERVTTKIMTIFQGDPGFPPPKKKNLFATVFTGWGVDLIYSTYTVRRICF